MNFRTQVSALASIGLIGFAIAAHASITGVWRAKTDHAEVRIDSCGDKVCGRLVSSDRLKAFPDQRDVRNHNAALRTRPLKGVMIMRDFSGGPTVLTGGTLYDPAGGGTYTGTLKLITPDTLKMTGCIVAPLCRSQTWTRID